MSLCEQCIQGVTHEGNPKGKWEKISGVDTYVATPEQEYAKDKAILYLADALGPQHINAQLLADEFAEQGFKTYALDYFNGDPIPKEALHPSIHHELSPTYDLGKWLQSHTQETTRPIVDKVVNALKEQGVTTFGATGYCFGGRYVFDLGIDNVIKVGAASHPSLLKIPEDLEKYSASSGAALLINSCTFDKPFPPEAAAKADELFGEGKFLPGYKRVHFENMKHGFAVRGDMSDPACKAAKEGAFESGIEWFKKHL